MATILGSAVLEYVSLKEIHDPGLEGEEIKASPFIFSYFLGGGLFCFYWGEQLDIRVSSDIPTLSSAYQHVNHYSLVFNCFLA